MIGILIVTHSQLGEALIDAAEFILGHRPPGVVSVSIDLNQNVDRLREKVTAGLKKVAVKHFKEALKWDPENPIAKKYLELSGEDEEGKREAGPIDKMVAGFKGIVSRIA